MKLDWIEKSLGDACAIYQPKTITGKDLIEDGQYPVFGANGIIGRYDKYNHDTPQLLVTCRGATCGTINVSEPFSWITGNAMVVRPKDDSLDFKFFEYALRGGIEIEKAITGAAQPQITRANLAPLRFFYPSSIAEQRRIADILSRAEGIVRLRREAEKKAAELIPALFLDMFGDPATNPKGWRTYRLEELIAETKLGLVRGSKDVFEDGKYPYLRMNSVGNGCVCTSNLKRVNASQAESEGYALKAGDFLFNTRNSKELVGKSGIFSSASEPCTLFNNNLMRIRFQQDRVLAEFVNALFQTVSIQRQLESIKRGTTSVFAIYFKDLKNLGLIAPPLYLQQKFCESVHAARSIQTQQAAATAKAQAAFDALLAQVFTR